MGFDKWLQRFVTGIEKVIFRIALSFVVLLFVVQAVLLDDDLRLLFSKTDKLEGKPLQDVQDVISKGVTGNTPPFIHAQEEEVMLELQLIPPPGVSPELYLLLNNEIAGTFKEGSNLRVNVSPGDMLEVSGEVPGDVPATIKIIGLYGNLKAPQEGDVIETFGERELLAWILP